MKSLVSVSIWLGTSLKFVRSRLPATVSVATQPVSEVEDTSKGESSIAGSLSARNGVAGGGKVCARTLVVSRQHAASAEHGETRFLEVIRGWGRIRIPVT